MRGKKKKKKWVFWTPPCVGVSKFNVARGKQGPEGVGGVLHNNNGVVLVMLSPHVGCMESNEAEAVAILVVIWHFFPSPFQSKLVMQSDSQCNLTGETGDKIPWRFQFY